ncbi:acyl-CoA thioesterase [Raineya orbicola]|jgi:acyl-CoA thioester hydrolase|uniref:Thioesterase-like superfamily n=1 Tax=Raineya orbicola TaxID=2016530 RepID=A0A2N3IKY1_9BACT|nr:thioesterase family protein [Raineya orbicola]PKQ70928.1 Thioesterase-like superfamily [Raineya orbicola]
MTEKVKQLLQGYYAVIELPVQWGDMDLAHHVNNVMYARYAESARVAYLDLIAEGEAGNFGAGIGPILAEINIQYKMPLAYPDLMYLGTKVIDFPDEFSYTMESVIISKKHERIATRAIARIVSYDYHKRQKATTPQWIVEKVKKLQGM